jgi:hypothetical protein
LISGSTDVEGISALVSCDCLYTDVKSGKPRPRYRGSRSLLSS